MHDVLVRFKVRVPTMFRSRVCENRPGSFCFVPSFHVSQYGPSAFTLPYSQFIIRGSPDLRPSWQKLWMDPVNRMNS